MLGKARKRFNRNHFAARSNFFREKQREIADVRTKIDDDIAAFDHFVEGTRRGGLPNAKCTMDAWMISRASHRMRAPKAVQTIVSPRRR